MGREFHVRFSEPLGVRFPWATQRNVYVRRECAGRGVMKSISNFVVRILKLRLNLDKSAVAKPWERKFLGFSFTREAKPRRKIASQPLVRPPVWSLAHEPLKSPSRCFSECLFRLARTSKTACPVIGAQPAEPPYTVPYVLWCGRGGAAMLPPIPSPLRSSQGARR